MDQAQHPDVVPKSNRAYPTAAVERLLEPGPIELVNGSPVDVRSSCDLPAGHLDPWIVAHERRRQADAAKTGVLSLIRNLGEALFFRDRMLLRGRAGYDDLMRGPHGPRDLTDRTVEVSELEWELAGERRPVWRIARPSDRNGPRPVFLHLHGGAFSAGTPTGNNPFLSLIAESTDAVIFDLDYSMIPERTHPQPVLEAVAALAHIRDHGEEWGLDTSHIVIGGSSAGGNISAAAAIKERDAGNQIALQVLYVPFLNFGGKQPGLTFTEVGVTPAHSNIAGPQGDPATSIMVAILRKAYGGGASASDPLLSPALATDLTGLAPALIFTTEMDPLHQCAEHFAGDLARAGVPVTTIRFRGSKHDSAAFMGHVPQAEAAALQTAAAINGLG